MKVIQKSTVIEKMTWLVT